jgi:hypothetical protein
MAAPEMRALAGQSAEAEQSVPALHADRLYDVDDVRIILRPKKPMHPDTVYRIPERLLPKTRVGPNRGCTMWKGRDLMRYLGISDEGNLRGAA